MDDTLKMSPHTTRVWSPKALKHSFIAWRSASYCEYNISLVHHVEVLFSHLVLIRMTKLLLHLPSREFRIRIHKKWSFICYVIRNRAEMIFLSIKLFFIVDRWWLDRTTERLTTIHMMRYTLVKSVLLSIPAFVITAKKNSFLSRVPYVAHPVIFRNIRFQAHYVRNHS